jgi:hypothetical protein
MPHIAEVSTLSFFPWTTLRERLQFGRFQLVPFGEALGSGEVPQELHAAVVAVLESYGKTREVDRARVPLLRDESTTLVGELSSEQVDDYFAFRSRLTFAALAARRFFGNRYCNSDNFRLVVQGFTPERAGGAAITSRRRDGSARNFVPKGVLKVQRPEHVSGWCELPRDLDTTLLDALEGAHDHDGAVWARVEEAIRLFIGANTDSPDVGMHAELVDTVSAFSRLADSWNARGTVEGFLAALPPSGESVAGMFGPRVHMERLARVLSEGLPVRAEWLGDAYRLRSQYGHGHVDEPPYKAAWSVREHLLLGAIALPLAIKGVLRRDGRYTFSPYDEALNEAFDALATLEPFAQNADDENYPWREVMNTVLMRPLARQLAASLEAQVVLHTVEAKASIADLPIVHDGM